MGAQENKRVIEDAYRAFSSGDAEGAMANMDDSIAWTEAGENSVSGTHTGKQAVGELWGKLAAKGFSLEPLEFIADGDKVVVLTKVTLDGETVDGVHLFTLGADGKVAAFDSLGDPRVSNRVFAA